MNVNVTDDVQQGQNVATMYNVFGDKTHDFVAPRAGKACAP